MAAGMRDQPDVGDAGVQAAGQDRDPRGDEREGHQRKQCSADVPEPRQSGDRNEQHERERNAIRGETRNVVDQGGGRRRR